jgi:hypothetical protein
LFASSISRNLLGDTPEEADRIKYGVVAEEADRIKYGVVETF